MSNYSISYSELAILTEYFEKESEVRGINYPDDELKTQAFIEYCLQYENDPDTDPHIECLCGVTCEKEIDEINWNDFYENKC